MNILSYKPKVYLASRYSRGGELVLYASILRDKGLVVTSRWLEGNHQIEDDELSDDAKRKAKAHFATEDFEDVLAADVVISFTEAPRQTNSRGGRHVELGIALGAKKTCIVIGPHENVFHLLPQVHHYASWEDFWEAQFRGPYTVRLYRTLTGELECCLVDGRLYSRKYRPKRPGEWELMDPQPTSEDIKMRIFNSPKATKKDRFRWNCIASCLLDQPDSPFHVRGIVVEGPRS